MNKKRKILFKICIILGIAYTGWICFNHVPNWYLLEQMYGSRVFDPSLWNKTHVGKYTGGIVHDYMSYRCGMYNDLVKNHLKKGMKIYYVTHILGETDFKSFCSNKKIKCLRYTLGGCSEWNESLNHNYIEVCFNEKEEAIGFGKGEFNFKGTDLIDYSDNICGGEDKVIMCLDNECVGHQKDKNGLGIKIDYEQW
jgi:hypothetical protein